MSRGHEHITLLSTRRQAAITHFKLGAHVTEKYILSEHQSGTFFYLLITLCVVYINGENRGKLQPQKVATKDGLISYSTENNISYKQEKSHNCAQEQCFILRHYFELFG